MRNYLRQLLPECLSPLNLLPLLWHNLLINFLFNLLIVDEVPILNWAIASEPAQQSFALEFDGEPLTEDLVELLSGQVAVGVFVQGLDGLPDAAPVGELQEGHADYFVGAFYWDEAFGLSLLKCLQVLILNTDQFLKAALTGLLAGVNQGLEGYKSVIQGIRIVF